MCQHWVMYQWAKTRATAFVHIGEKQLQLLHYYKQQTLCCSDTHMTHSKSLIKMYHPPLHPMLSLFYFAFPVHTFIPPSLFPLASPPTPPLSSSIPLDLSCVWSVCVVWGRKRLTIRLNTVVSQQPTLHSTLCPLTFHWMSVDRCTTAHTNTHTVRHLHTLTHACTVTSLMHLYTYATRLYVSCDVWNVMYGG